MNDATPPLSYTGEGGSQLFWDATSVELAQTCLRKYYYKNIVGWRPKRTSVHLVFGGLYASALESFHKYRALGADTDESLRRVVKECLIASWDYEKNAPMQFEHAAKTRFNLVRTIVWYVEQFGREVEGGIQTFHLKDGTPAVELSFQLDIDETLIYCGHLDQVVTYGDDKYIQDQKTTGSTISTRFFEGFKPSNQMSGYTWAGQMMFDTPISGVIIDGAQIAVGFTRFERGFVHYTQAEIDEWFVDMRYTVDLARIAVQRNTFPMNRSSCGNYGGCEFRGVCSRSPQVRDNFLRADFDLAPRWNPAVPR